MENGKQYIGSSTNYYERRKTHLGELKRGCHSNNHLQNSYNKYGKEIIRISILEKFEQITIEDLLLKEDEWVLKFDTLNEEKGYNKMLPSLQRGVFAAMSLDEKCKNKMFLTKAPCNLKKISKEEWVERRKQDPSFKVRSIKKENPISNKKRVVKVCPTSKNIIEIFDSITKAAGSINVQMSRMQSVTSNNKELHKYTAKKFLYILEEDFSLEKFPRKKEKTYKEVKDYNIKRIPMSIENVDTLEIKDFVSVVECADFLKCKVVRVHELIKGFRNKGNGVTTKFLQYKGWRIK